MEGVTETLLSELTTIGVGGPARRYVRATAEDQIVQAVREADERQEPVLILGGGSNLVVSDEGFRGTVIHVASRGIAVEEHAESTLLTVAAGEAWDDVVRYTVDQGFTGLETLSGIPGTAGATPVQNVGAYGTEISQHFASALVYDRKAGQTRRFRGEDLEFSYRNSLLKREIHDGSPRYVVLSVQFDVRRSNLSQPIRYAELARRLGVEVGERAEAATVRETVIELRSGKGMVLDPSDRDSYSTGSFFTNPIIAAEQQATIPEDAPRYPVLDQHGAVDESKIKLSAAWLIQNAGFDKGFGLQSEHQPIAGGRASLSTKHTLAITNRGGATARDILAIARTVRDGVREEFGVTLEAEPVIIGFTL
ncbi:UDP-N-acetylmuramate dehydrogenase [Kocuria massiliensis]|uniref:UDP-N-acetylmuramate dehydrogenase n=1 Tax=Kocuria massiliensis TaxID=1926282 RepID=UPI0022B959A4|nr:UDP-N-acetylmuramate dehydrogenase [Kocuria massiliensis]